MTKNCGVSRKKLTKKVFNTKRLECVTFIIIVDKNVKKLLRNIVFNNFSTIVGRKIITYCARNVKTNHKICTIQFKLNLFPEIELEN